MAELMDMDRIVQSVKAINVAWNNCHFKVWLGLTLIAFLVGCSSQPEAAKPILDPGGNVVKPTAAEMTFVPTMTFTPESTFTPTVTTTPTETSVPTETPTKTEIPRVMLSMDINTPARVPWEDAAAGRMESASNKPFPKDANFIDSALGEFFHPMYNCYTATTLKSFSPDTSPIRISGYGRTTTPRGVELYIICEDVANLDGTIGHWNFIADQAGLDFMRYEYFGRGWTLVPIIKGDKPLEKWPNSTNELHDISRATMPDQLEYLREFVEDQIVPEGMEQGLMVPGAFPVGN